MARGNDSQIHVPRCNSGQHYSLGIQSPCQMMIGVYNHLRNARYLGSMKPFSEGDWIPRDSLFFKNFQSHSCGCSKVKKVDRRYIIIFFSFFVDTSEILCFPQSTSDVQKMSRNSRSQPIN